MNFFKVNHIIQIKIVIHKYFNIKQKQKEGYLMNKKKHYQFDFVEKIFENGIIKNLAGNFCSTDIIKIQKKNRNASKST